MNETAAINELNNLRAALSVANADLEAGKITRLEVQILEDKYRALKEQIRKEIDNDDYLRSL